MKTLYKVGTLLLLCALLIPTTSFAATGYQIDWWTIDGGGGTSQSASGMYSLSGTIGQPEAGNSEGGSYNLRGGFWVEGILDLLDFLIHLPLVVK